MMTWETTNAPRQPIMSKEMKETFCTFDMCPLLKDDNFVQAPAKKVEKNVISSWRRGGSKSKKGACNGLNHLLRKKTRGVNLHPGVQTDTFDTNLNDLWLAISRKEAIATLREEVGEDKMRNEDTVETNPQPGMEEPLPKFSTRTKQLLMRRVRLDQFIKERNIKSGHTKVQ